MVATVIRLRYRSLANTLARRPSQLVGFCLGSLWAASALAVVVAAMIALAVGGDLAVNRVVVTLGGAALILGWIIGPSLIAGMDTTVDASHLAPFPLSRRQVMLALAGVALTGIPGAVSAVAGLATAAVWMTVPAAALVAVPMAAIGVLTCVVAGRLAVTTAARVGASRRGREVTGSLLVILVILTVPIFAGAGAAAAAIADMPAAAARAAQVVAWTPLGAAWSVPADVAAGHPVIALVRAAIAVATVLALWVLWSRAVGHTAPVTAPVARHGAAGRFGLFGLVPTGGVGATFARSLSGWLRDPRYLRQLLIVPVFPVLFAFSGGVDGWVFPASAVLVAFVLAIGGYTDVSYDGTAFATVVATGIRGWADRAGRALAYALVGVPLVLVVAVGTLGVAGRWSLLPAIAGAALGLLLTGIGVSAVSSALVVVPVPAAGDNPFTRVPGQSFVNGLFVFAVMGATLVLALPGIVPTIVAVATGSATAGWIALAAGCGAGVAVVVVGVVVGGRVFDRHAVDLLARIRSFPTA